MSKEQFKTIEFLECVLTQEELLERANILSNKNQEKSRIEGEKKAINSEFTAKINSCEAQIEKHSLAISTRRESRDIDCEIKFNEPGVGQKTVYRLDTKELVKIYAMTGSEKSDMFINNTGEQNGKFIFNTFQEVPIVAKEKCGPEDVGVWQTIGQPQRAEDMVSAIIDEDIVYRVIKGEDENTGVIGYLLQKNVAGKGPETVEKPKAGKKGAKGKKKPATSKETPKAEEKEAFIESAMPKKEAPPVIDDGQAPKEPNAIIDDCDPTCETCEGSTNKDLCKENGGCIKFSNWQPAPKVKPTLETPLTEPPPVIDDLTPMFELNGISKGEAETYLQKQGNLGMKQSIDENEVVAEWVRQNLKSFIMMVKKDLAGMEPDPDAPKIDAEF